MLIDDIAYYLQLNGIGTVGTDILMGTTPALPDNVVVLSPTPGFCPQDTRLPDMKVTIQVLVRDAVYQTAYQRTWQVFNLLDNGGDRYTCLPSGRQMASKAMQAPFFLEQDANSRTVFVFNLLAISSRD